MKVTIADIPEEGLRLTERCDPAALALETPDVQVTAPVEVAAVVHKADDDLVIEVEAESALQLVCARCAQRYPQPYHGVFQLEVEIGGRQVVDVTDDIRQEMMLSYPIKFLCREGCRGLCPSCGQNLNEGPCACHRGEE